MDLKKGKDYGDSLVKQINTINELLTTARKKGIQMKTIAEAINISPSVLSAFYRTVMPAFLDNCDRMGVEPAMEYAFSLVNNISQTRFTPFFPNIIIALEELLAAENENTAEDDKRFLDNFISVVNRSQQSTQQIEGIYRTYSISSSDYAMKCEPMIISRTKNGILKAIRLSVHDVIQEGFGMVVSNQAIVFHLNEAKYPKYYPLTMSLNIPMCFDAKIYRGIYLAVDSSSHPIARRIILKKVNDSTKVADFQQERAVSYPADAIPEELKDYFDYLKERKDILRVSVIPEPTADERDLKLEKRLLKVYEEL